ncbi:MAG TPA: hypothetical protein VNW23_02070 [Opitutaceae bacterium]|jgi:hypothetical protein|nr:hypothetical protein [Opitutaceae bacterium]
MKTPSRNRAPETAALFIVLMIVVHVEFPLMILVKWAGVRFLFGYEGKLLIAGSVILLSVISLFYFIWMKNGDRITKSLEKSQIIERV